MISPCGRQMDEYTKHIREAPWFNEAVAIARSISQDPLYLIGGAVYRTLISAYYNRAIPFADLDFLVGKRAKSFTLPPHMKCHVTDYDGIPAWTAGEHDGVLKITAPHLRIDILSMDNLPHPKTLANYLYNVPFTIQSIAYEIDVDKLWGETGIRAILDKSVGINNEEAVRKLAEANKVNVEQLLWRKAAELGFEAVLPFEGRTSYFH
ncbi:hypothetical protein HY490_05030 [Candidatus Woesearchaeota archaeon]|nr:hypothetical protein [Candidatus Woesearchaeota archaeon]